MADDNLKDLTSAQKQTNETLLKINENIRKQLEGVKEAVKEPPKDIEAEKEKKANDKKFLEGLKGVLKSAGGSAVGGGKGLLDGVKKMFSKYKKLIVGLLGVGLVALFTQLDIKQLEKFWKAFKGALEKVYNVLQPLAESIATWGMKTLLPATITLFKEQWDNLTQMFVGIKEQLAGWNEKTGTEKFTAILGVFGVIGSFAMDTAASILDWGAKLLGYDGSLVKDIKAKWEEWFGPSKDGMVSKLGGVFKSMVGLFALGKIIGGTTGSLLTAPLKVAIMGAKGAGGLIGNLASAMGGAMPAIGTIAKGLGIAGLVIAVGKGILDGYKKWEEGGTVKDVWTAGLSGFMQALTLGMVSKETGDKWAKGITNFFGDIYDTMFGKTQKELTQKEIKELRELKSGKKYNEMSQEEKNAEQERLKQEQLKRRRGGASSAVAKGDLKGIEAEIESVYNEMDAANLRKENAPGERKQTLARLKKRLDQLKADEAAIYDAKKPSMPIVTPVKIEKGQIDWGFISKKEGGSRLQGYVPDPKGSKSGVTIATGFDLGARGPQDIKGLSPELQAKLKPFLGLKGMTAIQALLDRGGLKITSSEAKEIDKMSKGSSLSKLKSEWNKNAKKMGGKMFEDLSSAQKTVAASVAFQYGSLDRTPAFRDAMQSGKWDEAVAELENFGDKYSTRRLSEAALLKNESGRMLTQAQRTQGAGGNTVGGSTNFQQINKTDSTTVQTPVDPRNNQVKQNHVEKETD